MSATVPSPERPGRSILRRVFRRAGGAVAAVAIALTVVATSVAEQPPGAVVALGDDLPIVASIGVVDGDLAVEEPATAAVDAPADADAIDGDGYELDPYALLEQTLRDVVARYGNSTDGYLNGRLPDHVLCRLPWVTHHRLRCDAAHQLTALNELFREHFGRDLPITDSYRTFESQVRLRQRIPHLAAVPGTSKHGWGLAVDFGVPINTGLSAEYLWLRLYGPRFGWDNPPWARLDGSKPEPWHWEFFAADPIPRRAMSPSDVAYYRSILEGQRPAEPVRRPEAPPVEAAPAPEPAPTSPAAPAPAPAPVPAPAPARPTPPPAIPAPPAPVLPPTPAPEPGDDVDLGDEPGDGDEPGIVDEPVAPGDGGEPGPGPEPDPEPDPEPEPDPDPDPQPDPDSEPEPEPEPEQQPALPPSEDDDLALGVDDESDADEDDADENEDADGDGENLSAGE